MRLQLDQGPNVPFTFDSPHATARFGALSQLQGAVVPPFTFTLPILFKECFLFPLRHALVPVFRCGSHSALHLLLFALCTRRYGIRYGPSRVRIELYSQ